jgi:hypothetical protein
VDVGVQPDLDAINTERADRLVQLDLSLLDVEALRFQLVGNVGGGDGTEELAFLAYPGREGERDLFELGRQLRRRAAALLFRLLETLTFLLNALAIARGRLVGETTRQEIIRAVLLPV